MDMGSFAQQFAQQLINGISLGSIYALIALGYTMIYGIIKLINFAHGDIYMLGAYMGFVATTMLGLSFVPHNCLVLHDFSLLVNYGHKGLAARGDR